MEPEKPSDKDKEFIKDLSMALFMGASLIEKYHN
jgi:hypothetical protein